MLPAKYLANTLSESEEKRGSDYFLSQGHIKPGFQ